MNPAYFFCPNPCCPNSLSYSPSGQWYKREGYHKTKAFGAVQRYRCKHCGKTFSDQTFLLNYYLKRYTDFDSLFDKFNSSNSSCFIAREMHMSFESIRIRRDRVARNSLFLQSIMTADCRINEPVAADGFESYTRSKYYPTNINILVGAKSCFLHYFTESHSRRKGRTTEKQKERMESEYDDKSFTGCSLAAQFKTLLQFLVNKCAGNTCELRTDEHKTYPVVLEELSGTPAFPAVTHTTVSSREIRDAHNPLRSVNYMDMLFRKDIPNHRRKTICFAKNDRNMLSRMSIYMVSHNFFKPSRVSDKAAQVANKHYTSLGIDENKLAFWKWLFLKYRFFYSKVDLPEYFDKVWKRCTETPFGENWYPLPKFALQ